MAAEATFSHTAGTSTDLPITNVIPPTSVGGREQLPRGRFLQRLRRMRPPFLARSRPPVPPPKDTPPMNNKPPNTLGRGALISDPPFMPSISELGVVRSQSARAIERPVLKPKASSRSINESSQADPGRSQIRTRERSFSDLSGTYLQTMKGVRAPPPVPRVPSAYREHTTALEHMRDTLRVPSGTGGKSNSSRTTSGSIPIVYHASHESVTDSVDSNEWSAFADILGVWNNGSSNDIKTVNEQGWLQRGGDKDRISADSDLFAIAPERQEFKRRRESKRPKAITKLSEASSPVSSPPDQSAAQLRAYKNVFESASDESSNGSYNSSGGIPLFFTSSSAGPDTAQQSDNAQKNLESSALSNSGLSVPSDGYLPGVITDASDVFTHPHHAQRESIDSESLKERLDWLQESHDAMTAIVQEQDAALQRASYLLDLRVSAIEFAQNEQFPLPNLCIPREGQQGNSLGSFHQNPTDVTTATMELRARLFPPRTDSLRNRVTGGIYGGRPPAFTRRKPDLDSSGGRGHGSTVNFSTRLSPIQSRSTSENVKSSQQTSNNIPLQSSPLHTGTTSLTAGSETHTRFYFDAEDEEQQEAFEKFASAMTKWKEDKMAAQAAGRSFTKRCPAVFVFDTESD